MFVVVVHILPVLVSKSLEHHNQFVQHIQLVELYQNLLVHIHSLLKRVVMCNSVIYIDNKDPLL